jgi:hypothetical protein
MKKTTELISLGTSIETKYSLDKNASPDNLSYKLIDIGQYLLDKMRDPKYQRRNVQSAMEHARKSINSLIMELTHGEDPVETNTYED